MGETSMTNEDRKLLVETLAEMKELKGEMKEFKEHVIGRVVKLENKEAARNRERVAVIGAIVAILTLLFNVMWKMMSDGGHQ